MYVFSKYLHLVPVKTKSAPSIALALRSIFHDHDFRRPVWLRIDKGNEFLNKDFQDMLCDESNEFQVCKNPDVKYDVELANTTIRGRLYRKNTKYIDVLPNFFKDLQWHTSLDHRNGTFASDLCTHPRYMASEGGPGAACFSRDGQVSCRLTLQRGETGTARIQKTLPVVEWRAQPEWCTLSLIRLYLDNLRSKCNQVISCLFVKELALL